MSMYQSVLATLEKVRKRIEDIEEENFRHAFMYQYLIGGNVSEVAGKYAPQVSDMHQIECEANNRKIKAIMFIIDVAKKPNFYRACLLPLDPIYDPWVEQVQKWFTESKTNKPFYLGTRKGIKDSSNKSALMKKGTEIFKGLNWLTGAYTTSDHQRDRENVKFTANRLRNLRQSVLEKIYGFTEVDLAYFGAWYNESIHEEVNEQVELIKKKSPQKTDVSKFKELGETYFKKLLMRNDHFSYIPRDFSLKDYVEQSERAEKASNIIDCINQINKLSKLRLGYPLFNESLDLALDIIDDCKNMDTLQSNITEAMKMFEIKIPFIKREIKVPKGLQSRKSLRAYFTNKGVSYPSSMFETWDHMWLLRGYFDHPSETEKLRSVLEYYDEPLLLPNPPILWQKILDKFKISLIDLYQALERLEPLSPDEKQPRLIIGDSNLITSLMMEETLEKVTKIESYIEKLNSNKQKLSNSNT